MFENLKRFKPIMMNIKNILNYIVMKILNTKLCEMCVEGNL
jgi:hypothetical protein